MLREIPRRTSRLMTRRQVLRFGACLPLVVTGCNPATRRVARVVLRVVPWIGAVVDVVSLVVDVANLVLTVRAMVNERSETAQFALTADETDALRNGAAIVIQSREGAEIARREDLYATYVYTRVTRVRNQ